MRACFMGQNVTALGFGVAILHTPRLPDPEQPLGERPIPPEGGTPRADQPAPQQKPPVPA
jgi:hypothetical protein